MNRKYLALGSIVISSGFLFFIYLFRSEVVDNPAIGIITYHYKWGRPARIEVDSNRDGKTNFIGEIDGPFGAYAAHTAELIEYWEDRDFNGHFELHIFVGNTGPFNDLQIQEIGIDKNGDGKYELTLRDEEAREYYRRLSMADAMK